MNQTEQQKDERDLLDEFMSSSEVAELAVVDDLWYFIKGGADNGSRPVLDATGAPR